MTRNRPRNGQYQRRNFPQSCCDTAISLLSEPSTRIFPVHATGSIASLNQSGFCGPQKPSSAFTTRCTVEQVLIPNPAAYGTGQWPGNRLPQPKLPPK